MVNGNLKMADSLYRSMGIAYSTDLRQHLRAWGKSTDEQGNRKLSYSDRSRHQPGRADGRETPFSVPRGRQLNSGLSGNDNLKQFWQFRQKAGVQHCLFLDRSSSAKILIYAFYGR